MNENLLNGMQLISVDNFSDWNWEVFLVIIVFVSFGIIMLTISNFVEIDDFELFGQSTLILGLFALFCFGIVTAVHCYSDENIIEYKVTIDENVSFIELADEFEVLEYDGKIYTIREK